MKVDVRKVQMVGYSTLSVSLPKDWVKKIGIKPGDVVSIIRLDDGSLKIRPGLMKEEGEKVSKILDASSCDEPGLLSKLIIALYLTGSDSVTVTSERGLTQQQLAELRSAVERLNGFSVVEESPNTVVIQSFIDPASSPVGGLMRRMQSLTSSILDLAYKALKEGRRELIEDARRAEEEVDRLYWLVVRQLVLASTRPELQQKLGVDNPRFVPGDRMVAKLLEKIGDYAMAAAEAVDDMLEKGAKPKDADVSLIGKYTSEAMSVYAEAFDGWFRMDSVKANMIVENSAFLEGELRKAVVELTNRYLEESVGKEGPIIALSLKTYMDNLVQVINFSGTIAESAINKGVIEPTEITCRASASPAAAQASS